jgi:mono/diheme cytochrome c family protein
MKYIILGAAAVFVLSNAVWAVEGQGVYEKKCKTCHSIGGVAGPMAKMGGPLDGVGSKHDEAWFKEYIKDPKSKNPTSKMPKASLTDEELNAVAAYVAGLKK